MTEYPTTAKDVTTPIGPKRSERRSWHWVSNIQEYQQYMEDVFSEFQPLFEIHKERLDEIRKEEVPPVQGPKIRVPDAD